MAKGNTKKAKQTSISGTELLHLHRWNRWFAIAHAVEGIIIFLFAAAYSAPVFVNYLAVDPINSAATGHTVLSTATRQLFNVSIPGLIAIFFLVTAFAHALLVTVYRKRYETELSQGINTVRWLEYAITAGLMLTIIALLSGVYDFATLIAIFGFMVIMCLLGLVTELTSKASHPNWPAYWSGAVAGFAPWLIIALYVFDASYYGMAHIPTYVYWIYATMFVCTVGFALNMYLHYKKHGKWVSYVYTERCFMVLSLVTKSLLAWQIFVGVLRP
jgi:hypothetical protein